MQSTSRSSRRVSDREDERVTAGERRIRLGRVIHLARVYRGWDLKTLAKKLKRDPTRLIPESGNPKIDLVHGLARTLDWPIAEVIKGLQPTTTESDQAGRDGSMNQRRLDRRFLEAYESRHLDEALEIAESMARHARNNDQRLVAASRLHSAHEAVGEYDTALNHARSSVGIARTGELTGLVMTVNLANAHYAVGHLTEAGAIASEVIDLCSKTNPLHRGLRAFAHYVRGNTRRRMIWKDPGCEDEHALGAQEDLESAHALHLEVHAGSDDSEHGGIAETCLGGILEVKSALGRVDPLTAVNRLNSAPLKECDRRLLESRGWWSIFAANIALRHLNEEERVECLAHSARRLRTVADRLGHGAFHAQSGSIELMSREQARACSLDPGHWTMQSKDLRTLIHTMGRLPIFQETGWRILVGEDVLARMFSQSCSPKPLMGGSRPLQRKKT